MEHTIIIWEQLKKRNKDGKFNFRIANRYQLTEEEICQTETAKYMEDVSEDSEYEYYAEIEGTNH